MLIVQHKYLKKHPVISVGKQNLFALKTKTQHLKYTLQIQNGIHTNHWPLLLAISVFSFPWRQVPQSFSDLGIFSFVVRRRTLVFVASTTRSQLMRTRNGSIGTSWTGPFVQRDCAPPPSQSPNHKQPRLVYRWWKAILSTYTCAVLVRRLASEKKQKKSKIFLKKLQKKAHFDWLHAKKTTKKAHFDYLQAKPPPKNSSFFYWLLAKKPPIFSYCESKNATFLHDGM